MPKTLSNKSTNARHRPVYWWSNELTQIRECLGSRRRTTRAAAKNGLTQIERDKLVIDYKGKKESSREQFLCKEVTEANAEDKDNDIWGCGYKMVTGKIKPQTGRRLSDARQLQIAETILPTRKEIETVKDNVQAENIPPFTGVKLQDAARKIKGGKAVGPDMIPPEIVKITVETHNQAVLEAMNDLPGKGVYLKEWKTARLVLLEKKRAEDGEMRYRPLCMLNGYSKILEHLLVARLLTAQC